jgi:hypothetical protein
MTPRSRRADHPRLKRYLTKQSPAATSCWPSSTHFTQALLVQLTNKILPPCRMSPIHPNIHLSMDSFQAFGLASEISAATIQKRQRGILAIPTTYLGLNSGPQPGVLVGIVLGAVFGFLLIVYLIYAIASFGGGYFRRTTVVEEEVVRRRSTSPRRRRRRVYEEEDVVEVIEERRSSRRPSRVGS